MPLYSETQWYTIPQTVSIALDHHLLCNYATLYIICNIPRKVLQSMLDIWSMVYIFDDQILGTG